MSRHFWNLLKLFSDLTLAAEMLSVAYKVLLTRDYQKDISWSTGTVAIKLTQKVIENFAVKGAEFKIEDPILTHVFEIVACGTTKLDFTSSKCGAMASTLLKLIGSVKNIGAVRISEKNRQIIEREYFFLDNAL